MRQLKILQCMTELEVCLTFIFCVPLHCIALVQIFQTNNLESNDIINWKHFENWLEIKYGSEER